MASEIITSTSRSPSEHDESGTRLEANSSKLISIGENLEELQEQVIENLKKPNVPNVNVPEKILICLDVCYDNQSSLFRLGDGTTYTPINMLKRVLEFLIHSKHAINKKTEFALLVMKDDGAVWMQNFTSNIKEIINSFDNLKPEESTSDQFDFSTVLKILQSRVEIPHLKSDSRILPPENIVRLIVIYCRSNCLPVIPLHDEYFLYLKKQLYFYVDILFAHEEDCTVHKCEEVYNALQHLDNGYSYVFEVSRNATIMHESIAKLLAHPLQRPLQKNTDYSFGSRHKQHLE